jgi:hypothetical protein
MSDKKISEKAQKKQRTAVGAGVAIGAGVGVAIGASIKRKDGE